MNCHRIVTRDSRVTTPVSHATNTTPHHTFFMAGAVGGSFVARKSSNGSAVETTRAKTDDRYAARFGGVR